jgi:subtilisin
MSSARSDISTPWVSLEEARASLTHGTGAGVRIALLDSGIELSHPALAGLRVEEDLAVVETEQGIRLESGGGTDVFGHGTAVASILHRQAPGASIGSFRVLGPNLRSRTTLICHAARAAIERGYHILSCSFGSSREDHVLLYKSWVDRAYRAGRHVVAAAANPDALHREWPAHFTSVVAVTFASGLRPGEVVHRPGEIIEFAALGEDVSVAWLNGSLKQVTGSSFAVPHVVAILARLLSRHPGMDPPLAAALLRRLAIRREPQSPTRT